MAPPGRKVTDYIVKWVNGNRQLVIRPKRYAPSDTPIFGLGNATIRLDMNNLPKKVLKKITGETTNNKLVPVLPTRLHRWTVSLSSIGAVVKDITGFNGSTAKFKYFEAADFEMHHHEVEAQVMHEDRRWGDGQSAYAFCNGYGSVFPFFVWQFGIRGIQASGDIPWELFYKNEIAGEYNKIPGTMLGLSIIKDGRVAGYNSMHFGNLEKSFEIGEIDGAVPVEVSSGSINEQFSNIYAFIRFSDGSLKRKGFAAETYNDSPPVELTNVDDNVARITRFGTYYYTGEYYKAGPGNTAVVPFLSDGKGNDFILSVFENYFGDSLLVLENGRVAAVAASGATKHFPLDTKIENIVSTNGGDFVVTGSYGNYTVYEMTGKIPPIQCEDFGGIHISSKPPSSFSLWGQNGQRPFPELPVSGASIFEQCLGGSEWSTTGNRPGVGSVVGGDVYHKGDIRWKAKAPDEGGDYYPRGVYPFYVKNGKTHVLRLMGYTKYILDECNINISEEMNVIVEADPVEAYNKLYNTNKPYTIVLHKENASNPISGLFPASIFYDERPQVTYDKDHVSDLYFKFA